MNILAFDTSTKSCIVALSYQSLDGQVLHQYFEQQSVKKHAQEILLAINQVLTPASLTLNDIDALALGIGPGSLTGVRIAVTVALGLCLTKSIPIIPLSSLQLLAETARIQFGYSHVLVAQDAQRNGLHFGAYQVGKNDVMMPYVNEVTTKIEHLAPIENFSWHAVGDMWAKHKPAVERSLNIQIIEQQSLVSPSPKGLINLAETLACIDDAAITVSALAELINQRHF